MLLKYCYRLRKGYYFIQYYEWRFWPIKLKSVKFYWKPVRNLESGRSCICVLVVENVLISTNFRHCDIFLVFYFIICLRWNRKIKLSGCLHNKPTDCIIVLYICATYLYCIIVLHICNSIRQTIPMCEF